MVTTRQELKLRRMDPKSSQEQMENKDRAFGNQGNTGDPSNADHKPDTVENVNQTMKSAVDIYEDFYLCKPPSFSGSMDSWEARRWLRRIELIFNMMEVTDEYKVELATNMLTDNAQVWWESTESLATGTFTDDVSEVAKVTWKQFVDAFHDQYIPLSFIFEMERKFVCLEQGDMSVAEYHNQFIKLSNLLPHLVRTKDIKCRRFEQGLELSIRSNISIFQINDYKDLVNRAKCVEWYLGEERQEQFKKGRFDTTATSRSGIGTSRNWEVGCYRCGVAGHIARNCIRQSAVRCFKCGQQGHLARYCITR